MYLPADTSLQRLVLQHVVLLPLPSFTLSAGEHVGDPARTTSVTLPPEYVIVVCNIHKIDTFVGNIC